MITLLTLNAFTLSTTPLVIGYTASNGNSYSVIFAQDTSTFVGASISSVTQSGIDQIKSIDPKLYNILLLDSNQGFEYYGEKFALKNNIYYKFSYYKWNSIISMFEFYKGLVWTSEGSQSRSGHKVKGFYTDYYPTNDDGFWGDSGGSNPQ